MKRAKRFISLVLTLLLMVNLLPATALATAGEAVSSDSDTTKEVETVESTTPHKHCVCGTGTDIGDHTSHNSEQVWDVTDTLPTKAGHYYLTANIGLDATWTPVDGIYLCLNGYKIYANTTGFRDIQINEGVNLTITDCHTGNEAGKITGLEAGNNDVTTDCGGVEFSSHDKSKTSFCIYNISICGNTAASGGGGVYVVYGTFSMYGATIEGNRTASNTRGGGGGIYQYTTSTVNIYDSKIINNESSNSSGAIYVYGIHGDAILNIYGATITGNSATNYEDTGGIYVSSSGSTLNLNGGLIIVSENTVGSGDETKVSNIWLEGSYININLNGKLSSGSSIGITVKAGRTSAITKYWHSKMCTDGENHEEPVFFADKSGYVVKERNKELYIVEEHEHSWDTAWSSNANGHYHKCTASGCTITDEEYNEHKVDGAGYADHIIGSVDKATCTASGTKTNTCSVCGYTTSEESDALGHDYKY